MCICGKDIATSKTRAQICADLKYSPTTMYSFRELVYFVQCSFGHSAIIFLPSLLKVNSLPSANPISLLVFTECNRNKILITAICN
jgi:hypothetical protein